MGGGGGGGCGCSGGGGGSSLDPLAGNPFFKIFDSRTTNGLVTIEFIAVPAPTGAAGLALGGLVATRRRRKA